MNPVPQETLELRLPSQLRFLSVVDSVVQSFVSEFDLSPDDVNNVSTATIEAASNAMEHANHFDASKTVLIRICARGTIVEVEIEDEGSGFNPQAYERELGPEDLLKVRGRGIYIMRSFMDEVRFARRKNGGMRVTLKMSGKASAGRSEPQDSTGGN